MDKTKIESSTYDTYDEHAACWPITKTTGVVIDNKVSSGKPLKPSTVLTGNPRQITA